MYSKQCISWKSKEAEQFLSSIPNSADEALLEDSKWYRMDVEIWFVPIQIIEDVLIHTKLTRKLKISADVFNFSSRYIIFLKIY